MERYAVMSWWNENREFQTLKTERTNDRTAAINALAIYANHPDCISCSIIDNVMEKCIMEYNAEGVD